MASAAASSSAERLGFDDPDQAALRSTTATAGADFS